MHTPPGQSQENGPWILGPSSGLSFDGLVVGALLRCLHTPPSSLNFINRDALQSEMHCWIDYTRPFGLHDRAAVTCRSGSSDFSDRNNNSLDHLYYNWSWDLALFFVVVVPVCLYLVETNV